MAVLNLEEQAVLNQEGQAVLNQGVLVKVVDPDVKPVLIVDVTLVKDLPRPQWEGLSP